jgi:solute carrier family 25 (mitochondrial phosphate transporter), member 23/24/25/41
MWQAEGLRGFFKGNSVNVIRIAPFTACQFFFYDLYKTNFFGGSTASGSSKLLCGGLTGMTASIITYPLDLIRTLLAVDVGTNRHSIIDMGRQVIHKHGV